MKLYFKDDTVIPTITEVHVSPEPRKVEQDNANFALKNNVCD